jgi:hypothetical protein
MKPPKDQRAELGMALAKGAVSAIPIFGGVISELADLYVNPLEKRKQVWMKEVGQAIDEINHRFSLIPGSLEEDESFISFLYQITDLALKNHQQEKLVALRNALVSAADPKRVSDDLVFQFIRYIDELSVTHLQILTGLDKWAGAMRTTDKLEHVYFRLQRLAGISLDRAMFRLFIQDLDTKLLIRTGDIDDLPEFSSKVSHLLLEGSDKRALEVTQLGKMFISFVNQIKL